MRTICFRAGQRPTGHLQRGVGKTLLPLGVVLAFVLVGCGSSTGGEGVSGNTTATAASMAASCPGSPVSGIPAGDAAGADQAGQASAPPWDAPSDVSGGLQQAGLNLNTMEGAAQHFHAHLDVINDGQAIQVPGGIGIAGFDPSTGGGTGYSSIHTHDDSGIIHVESPDPSATYTLGQFFDEWGIPLSAHQIGGLAADSSNLVCAYVNGQLFSGDPATIQLQPVQEIELYYGPVTDIGQIIASDQGLDQILPQQGPTN